MDSRNSVVVLKKIGLSPFFQKLMKYHTIYPGSSHLGSRTVRLEWPREKSSLFSVPYEMLFATTGKDLTGSYTKAEQALS